MDFTDCTALVGAADVTSRRTVRSGEGPGDLRGSPLPIAAASGTDLAECCRALSAVSAAVQGSGPAGYQQALLSSQLDAQRGPFRVAIVAEHPAQLRQKQELLSAVLAAGQGPEGLGASGIFAARVQPADRVAVLFPGVGAHDPDMLRSAAHAFPGVREALNAARAAHRALTNAASAEGGAVAQIALEDDPHCAVFAADLAVFRWLQRYGLRVDAVMGQDVGELAALVAAGVLDLEDGLRAVRESARALAAGGAQPPGCMVALTCGVDQAQELLQGVPGYAAVAADTSPASCTVSGDEVAVTELLTRAARADVAARLLATPGPLHCRLLASSRPAFAAALEPLRFRRPKLALVSTISGTWADRQPLFRIREQVSGIWCLPVRLRQAVMALYTGRVRTFVECGPGRQLSASVAAVAAGHRHVAQPALNQGVGAVEQLFGTLACLFAVGACELQPPASRPRPPAPEVTDGDLELTDGEEDDAQLAAVLESLRSLIELVLPDEPEVDGDAPPTGADAALPPEDGPRDVALQMLLERAEARLLADLARPGPGSPSDHTSSTPGPRGSAGSGREDGLRPGDPEP
jgi:acyl transferase domain-containing protein